MAASLSFFTLFATGPVLIIMITLLGIFLSNEQTFTSIQIQLQTLTGTAHTTLFTDVYRNIIRHPLPSFMHYLLNFVLLMVTATTVIRYLQKSINALWDIPPEHKLSFGKKIHKRIIASLFLLFLSLLVILAFVINTFISFVEYFIGIDFTSFFLISSLLSFISETIFFFLVFKYFPDADIESKNVVLGACITGLLFMLGRHLVSTYLGSVNYASVYGAAGSLVGFLAWIYYSYLIFLFGAAFTYVYAKTYGRGVQHLS
jgi:membrane protein